MSSGFFISNDSANFKYPFVLCVHANRPKLIKDGNPFVFIEFVNADTVWGYMGGYPYKSSMGYAEQWLFYLKKITPNKYESEFVHMSNYDKYSINVYNVNGIWYFKVAQRAPHKPLQLEDITSCGCSDTVRKHVYVESLMNRKYYEKGITGSLIGGRYRYEINPYENKIYNLPFKELRDKVNALSLQELHLLFGIDTTGLN